ncbi:MAG: hypothetical protein II777_04355 [Clostridia bacterium]|nr:hypothetical protein [Clostridia bacterium]
MKKAIIKVNTSKKTPFENGLFGVNAEITRKGFFGGLSAQMLNNRKFFAGGGAPSGWECSGFEYVKDRREESLCKSNFVILDNGGMSQRSDVIAPDENTACEAAVWVKALSDTAEVTFGIKGGERTFPICKDGDKYKKIAFVSGKTGADTFTVKAKGKIAVFEASLMPVNNFYGMRRDVIEALRCVSPSSIRFPGGCAADHFDWRQSLAAPEFRTPADGSEKWFLFRDTYGQDCLDIGINEFFMLCKELGAEPEMTVSLLLSDGEDARRLVEYCNGGKDTEYGAIRESLGFGRFGVRLWYIGNEAYFFGREYQTDGALAAKRSDELIREMKKADPSLVPVIGLTWAKDFQKWNRDFVAALQSDVCHVSFHDYIGILPDPTQGRNGMATPEMLEGIFADGESFGLNFYKDELYKDNFDRISVCADEWNYSWGQDSNNALFFSNALQFHFLAKSGEKYHIRRAGFFMPVNEGMITVKGKECKIESTGEMFRLMHGHCGGSVVLCETDEALDVLSTEHGDGLYTSVVNRTGEEYEIRIEGYTAKECKQIEIEEYSFESNGFEITDNKTLKGHGVMFIRSEK